MYYRDRSYYNQTKLYIVNCNTVITIFIELEKKCINVWAQNPKNRFVTYWKIRTSCSAPLTKIKLQRDVCCLLQYTLTDGRFMGTLLSLYGVQNVAAAEIRADVLEILAAVERLPIVVTAVQRIRTLASHQVGVVTEVRQRAERVHFVLVTVVQSVKERAAEVSELLQYIFQVRRVVWGPDPKEMYFMRLPVVIYEQIDT